MLEIDVTSCTFDAETCPVVAYMFELDEFESTVQSIDPTAIQRRAVFGCFVAACVRGVCPPRNPALMQETLNRIQAKPE